jgi:hypothetical protein
MATLLEAYAAVERARDAEEEGSDQYKAFDLARRVVGRELRYASTSEGETLFPYDEGGSPRGWEPSDDLEPS